MNEERLLLQVERKAGIKFARIGAPQPADIIRAAAKDSLRWVGLVGGTGQGITGRWVWLAVRWVGFGRGLLGDGLGWS